MCYNFCSVAVFCCVVYWGTIKLLKFIKYGNLRFLKSRSFWFTSCANANVHQSQRRHCCIITGARITPFRLPSDKNHMNRMSSPHTDNMQICACAPQSLNPSLCLPHRTQRPRRLKPSGREETRSCFLHRMTSISCWAEPLCHTEEGEFIQLSKYLSWVWHIRL